MKNISFLFCLLVIVTSCKNYDNKQRYSLTVGEMVEIYYSTNSCCSYCLAKEKELKHIAFVERKTIDPGPENCAGCSFTAAFIFKAVSPGIDTVALKLLGPDMECDSNDVQPEKYIIEVK